MHDFNSGDYDDKFSDFYTYLGILGQGAFGVVVHTMDKYTGEELAVKIIRKRSMKRNHLQQLRQEAEILSGLNHPNIITFKHMRETSKRLFLGMEVIHGCNLKEYMESNSLSESQAHHIIKQVLGGVNYMHSQNVIHRDLKPVNILISKGNLVKITDFGLSAQFHPMQRHPSDMCGTLLFMAPEQAFNKFYSKAVDIWSCGIILYMLLTQGTHPITSTNDNVRAYLKKLESFKWQFPTGFPKLAAELILKMTDLFPLTRYTASQALNHPWILKDGKKAPLTTFEEFKLYSDLLKLKTIYTVLIFGSLFYRTRTAKKTSVPQRPSDPKPLKRTSNFMACTKSFELKRIGSFPRNRLFSPKNKEISPKTPDNWPGFSVRNFLSGKFKKK